MDGMEDNMDDMMGEIGIIEKYFGGELTQRQREQFAAMKEAYAGWNARINVVSRKDFDSLMLRHVLHSLAIARVCRFAPSARILDVGCGGGFPCVPLAVMFPQAHFTAVDSIGKKITVVRGVCEALGIGNIEAVNGRVESIGGRFDYAVSRAVTDMATLAGWVWDKIDGSPGDGAGTLPRGMLVLKGGDLTAELAAARRKYRRYAVSEFFDEEFFETKEVVYIPKNQDAI